MSLHLKSKTRTLFYHVLPSSGHVLASSLELWLSRYDDLLHLLCILRRTDKSGVSNRNWSSFSIQTLTSFSTMLLWSRNMFRRLLDHFPSWKIVIFRVKIFTRNTDAKDFILAMPTILFCLKGPKTSSHTVPREGCVVGCTLMRDKCSKSRPVHAAFRIVSKTSFTTIQAWILLPLPQTPGFCCPNISNQCHHFSKHNVIYCNTTAHFHGMTFIHTSVIQRMLHYTPFEHDCLGPMMYPQSPWSCSSETSSGPRQSIILFDFGPFFTL